MDSASTASFPSSAESTPARQQPEQRLDLLSLGSVSTGVPFRLLGVLKQVRAFECLALISQ
jgi:hypothetical protein